MTTYLGIDPGLNGAFAVLDKNKFLHIIDIPIHNIKVGKSVKKQIDLATLAMLFDKLPQIDMAIIENPHAMPRQGVSSSFKFGFVCGALQAFVASQFIPVTLVRPPKWKKAMGLTADKDATRLAASKLWPQHADMWPLVKHDGRAEAALLCEYGRTKL